MTTEVKLPEYGPEPIKLTSAVVELIANGIQIGNPAAAKALARKLVEEKKNFNALDDQYHRLGEKYEALQWQPIAKDNLPKVGDELFRIGADYPNDVDDIEAERGEYSTFRVYIKFGWTHFRPINPPTPEAKQ